MPEAQIKAALIQLHVGIKNSDGVMVSTSLNEIEALHRVHGGELHPQLEHFLAGRSYAKALAYLGGAADLPAKPASPPGGCSSAQK